MHKLKFPRFSENYLIEIDNKLKILLCDEKDIKRAIRYLKDLREVERSFSINKKSDAFCYRIILKSLKDSLDNIKKEIQILLKKREEEIESRNRDKARQIQAQTLPNTNP